jgi:signal transduction histidine kinase
MKSGKRPRPLLLFYILVVYVLIQFSWWTFLLVRLNNDVTTLRRQVIELQAMAEPAIKDTASLAADEKRLNEELHKQWVMIFGEGSVFLVLLVLGILRTRSAFRKEAAVSAQQKNFILSVTHELRSPLASTRLQLETLQKRELPRERQQEMQANAIQDIDRLNALVENILVAARIDNHSINIHLKRGDLSALLNELCEKVKPSLSKHTLATAISANIQASYDAIGVHSIFSNLVENAAKYSPPATEILVSLQEKNNAVYFSVSDRGPGIANAEKQNIFARFYRVGNEETRTSRGTGLGLFIVKHLVEAHGWNISVLDRPGGGTTFEIRIPK